MSTPHRHIYVAFAVKTSALPQERTMQLRRISVRHLRVAAPATHVYIRMNRGQAEAVVIATNNTTPEVREPYQYIEASEWVSATACAEVLDSSPAAA